MKSNNIEHFPLPNVDWTSLTTCKAAILNIIACWCFPRRTRIYINAEGTARLSQVEKNAELDKPDSEEDVAEAIKQYFLGIDTGAPHSIPVEVYKHSDEALLQRTKYLLCRMWDEGVLPQQHKDALVES